MKKSSLLLPLCAVVLATGCSVVKHSALRDDYDQVDKQRVKRLVVVTSPLPDQQEKLGEMWSRMARRYANQKRNFLAKKEVSFAELPAQGLRSLCEQGIDGVLDLTPSIAKKNKGMEAHVAAELIRCVDGQEVWATDAGGSWPFADPTLKELTNDYVTEFGPSVEPYVPATFWLLKATLDKLPDPVLTEDEVAEKIELGE